MPASSAARVVGAMGEDAENGGDLGLAEARYTLLHRTTGALLAKEPTNPERVFGHAQSENRLALLALTRGRSAEALDRFGQTIARLGTIAAWGRDRPDWLRLSAFGHGNLCAARIKDKIDAAAALPDCERAVADAERLAQLDRDDGEAAYDLGFHYLWLAEAQLMAGRDEAARATQARYLALTERLVRSDPANMLWREQQMQLYVRHAQLLRQRGEGAAGQDYMRRAHGIAGMLVARDPENAVWAQYRKRIDDELTQGDGQ